MKTVEYTSNSGQKISYTKDTPPTPHDVQGR
ncbi:MAG: hypothetical protein ACJAS4_003939 [Bacteriovoracaceae bacterium]|jgi:hypothetical protein